MQLNATAFRSEFDNLQVTALDPSSVGIVFSVSNAASAVSEGIEADLRWAATDRLRLSATAAYLRARFGRYTNAPCFADQTVAQGCVGGIQDLSGRTLQFAPSWKAAAEARYTWPVSGNLEINASARWYYSDAFALTLDLHPGLYQDSYSKVDGTLSLGRADGRWRVALVGQNLTDKMTASFGGAARAGATWRFADPPRAILVQARIAL